MPGKRKFSTTAFDEGLRSQLGIDISGKKKKTKLTRKEVNSSHCCVNGAYCYFINQLRGENKKDLRKDQKKQNIL